MDHLPKKIIKLGTRGSPLALVQAHHVQALLQTVLPAYTIEIVPIQTTGDKDQRTPLSELGGKNVFIRELETALQDHRIDLAVHSLKDVTSSMADGLILAGCLAPETNRDAWVALPGVLAPGPWQKSLPEGARIGTGSARRRALLKAQRPDLQCLDLRGNVGTRLQHLNDRAFDAILLSEVGLRRLNIQGYEIRPIEDPDFLPAPGQGVIAMQARNDHPILTAITAISDPITTQISLWEWQVLAAIGFDCRFPLGMETRVTAPDTFTLSLFLAHPTGPETLRLTHHFTAQTAATILAKLESELKAQVRDWTG